VRIAIPVLLEGYGVEADAGQVAFTLAGMGVPPAEGWGKVVVDTDRLPSAGPLTAASVTTSTACIGLLRWDAGEFTVQPLAVETTVRKKTTAVHAGAWAGGTADKLGAKGEKAATEAVTVLRERAGRLLRR
jgi:hypothetical protein